MGEEEEDAEVWKCSWGDGEDTEEVVVQRRSAWLPREKGMEGDE